MTTQMTTYEIIFTIANFILLVFTWNVSKLYGRFFKTRHKDYETFQYIVGISCSALTFVITMCMSVITIIGGSPILGGIEISICAITTLYLFISDCIKLFKKEKKKENYKSFNGVFAVSAIIITKDKKVLLVKRKQSNASESTNSKNLWVQPGVYYRTNTIHENPPELPPFYDYLIESIKDECGLTKDRYKPIRLNSIIEEKSATFDRHDLAIWNVAYNNNQLSQTPFLIQVEEGDGPERSGTSRHIDCFYAYELTIDDETLLDNLSKIIPGNAEKYEKVSTFTYEEVRQMSKKGGMSKNQVHNHCYPDLVIILEKFFELWRKELFLEKYKNNIRHCTFNPNNNTIWVRIDNNCNLNCQFCLMPNKVQKSVLVQHKFDSFCKFWNENIFFDKQKSYHLVVTGGEPFLVEKLYEMILYMDNNSNGRINSITVCTNGTLGTPYATSGIDYHANKNLHKMLEDTCSFKLKLKFVINMSAYDANTLCKISQKNQSDLHKRQCDFVETLHKGNVYDITANVVMTDILKNNLDKYFEYWRELGIRKIAFSYAIQLGLQKRAQVNSIKTLSKDECISLYNSLGNGQYPVEYFDYIELMIPSCDEKGACKENDNIIAYYKNIKNSWESKNSCLDIGV